MRPVYIAGVALTPIGEHWELSLRDLACEAALKALEKAEVERIDALYVANMGAAPLQSQLHLGALMADALGLYGLPAMRVEAAQASGGVAVHEAYLAVASGLYDSVLVIGVEKMSDALPHEVRSALAMAEDQEYTAYTGVTDVGLCALLHRLYMERYEAKPEEVAALAAISHEHAVGCPHAQYPFRVSVEKILSSPMEADPIHMLECSGIGDGAAALVLTADRGDVEIAASTVAVDHFFLTERSDPLILEAVGTASKRAYETAGISPRDIDLVELHDSTTIMGILSLEDLGFVEKGFGARYVSEGNVRRDGELPVNTFGGLKARGNPVGATGVYQVAEIALQLLGEAGRCQVEDAEVGLAENLGGVASTASITILRRH